MDKKASNPRIDKLDEAIELIQTAIESEDATAWKFMTEAKELLESVRHMWLLDTQNVAWEVEGQWKHQEPPPTTLKARL